jgi:hypothetical protein
MTLPAGAADDTPAPGAAGALELSVDVSAVPSQPVGAGRYTIDLVAALRARPEVDLSLWCRRDDARRWGSLGSAPPDSAGVTTTVRAVAPRHRPVRLAWEQLRLPGLLRGASVAVHHAPHYTMPERSPVTCVVTVHDLSSSTPNGTSAARCSSSDVLSGWRPDGLTPSSA